MFWEYGVEGDKGKIKYDVSKEISKAFNHFYSKFGIYADICKISTDIEEVDPILDFDGHKLTVVKDKMVALRNIWLGLSDETKELKPK
jgi:hypothetical protein